MVKVSITLPNATQISLEAEEAEIAHGVVGIVLRDLPQELMVSASTFEGRSTLPSGLEKGSSVTSAVLPGNPAEADRKADVVPDTASDFEPQPRSSAGAAGRQRTATQSPSAQDSSGAEVTGREPHSPEQERDFVKFCHSANPLGDMRRVVVAAEGANRIFAMPSVDAEDLAGLFDLAGWRRGPQFHPDPPQRRS